MHSTLKPEDPFNLNYCTGVHGHTSQEDDSIYMLFKIRSDFFLMTLQLILMMIQKYAMATDLLNWTKV